MTISANSRSILLIRKDLELGDVVYAANTITDDGSIRDGFEGEILAEAWACGVITLIGHVEGELRRSVFRVLSVAANRVMPDGNSKRFKLNTIAAMPTVAL